MKSIIENIKKNIKLVIGALVVGLLIGWLFFPSGGSESTTKNGSELSSHDHESEELTTWTCSMHPQIKQDKPGDCPICGMDLIPLVTMDAGGDDVDPNEIMMTESAAKLASIETMKVVRGLPEASVYLQGKIIEDERMIAKLTARFGGRIEQLYVNFTGQKVNKGQKLATIYSPVLVTAQRELLEALKIKDARPSLYAAAKSKLKLWDISDKQIAGIEENGEPQLYFDILSPITGTVTMRHVAIGEYVKEGMPLLKVVDLSKVWVLLDAYESDLPWIEVGDKVEFAVQSLPGMNYSGKVTFIDPFIDAGTRVAKVRVEINNPEGKLKPEMFVSATVNTRVSQDDESILIPKTALLWTGKRAVVYVKVPNRESPSFLFREIVLGPEAGSRYVVYEGLLEGEEIAVNGVFKIDAAAQLQGLPSMMNPDGGVPNTGHDHGQGDMGMSAEGKHAQFKVGGNCEMCKDRIESSAMSVHGVNSAKWDPETGFLHVSFDEKQVDLLSIEKAIAADGHDTENVKAPDDIYNQLPECCLYDRFDYDNKESANSDHTMFKVLGNCDMCKERIENAAMAVEGVESAEWDGESQMIHVNFAGSVTSPEIIQKAIAEAGHDTENFKAPDEVYNELPGCCLYDRN